MALLTRSEAMALLAELDRLQRPLSPTLARLREGIRQDLERISSTSARFVNSGPLVEDEIAEAG